jgi:hypothetical protein
MDNYRTGLPLRYRCKKTAIAVQNGFKPVFERIQSEKAVFMSANKDFFTI